MSNWTVTSAVKAVLDLARSQIGYQPGMTYSKYGVWYGSPNVLWCVAGTTWTFYNALGDATAKKVVGVQPWAPLNRGWSFTVAWREWLQENGKKVAIKDAQPGDILFYKYPTRDDRNQNPVNHADLVEENHASAGYLTIIGFNTPKPGTAGDPSNGRGVWRANRSVTDQYLVDAYRVNWDALGYTPYGKTVEEVQQIVGMTDPGERGFYGPATEQAVRVYQEALIELGALAKKADGLWDRQTDDAQEAVMEQLNNLAQQVQNLEAKIDQILANQDPQAERTFREQVLAQIKALPKNTATAVWQWTAPGHGIFNAWWWLRRGAVLNPEHKQFPADPGSPADIERKAAEKILGKSLPPYIG